MIFLILLIFFCCGLCASEDGDLGYGLNIGNAIDVFANYGDLSQVTQVVSADYESESTKEPIIPFSEKNIRVFVNVTSKVSKGESITNMEVLLCETFEDLLSIYFQNFKIEGTDKPWKAFMGDWIQDEIMRTFGIEYDTNADNCCYVLVKLTKIYRSVELDELKGVTVKNYVIRAIEGLNVTDPSEVRRFMKSYGTHYINSFVTGNFIYQVFKYKRAGYNMLRSYIRVRNSRPSMPDNLRFYFSSYFLKQVGDIKMLRFLAGVSLAAVPSAIVTLHALAIYAPHRTYTPAHHTQDSQWEQNSGNMGAAKSPRQPVLYSRPSLLRLHYNPILVYKLNDLLDNGALLGLGLKTLRPMFRDRYKAEKFAEIVENDLQLWEINA